MKLISLIVFIYAFLLLIGGFFAFTKAGSLISFGIGLISFILLFVTAFSMFRKDKYHRMSYWAALGVTSFLTIVFASRFFSTFKIWPPGILALFSLFVALILATSKK